MRLLSCLTCLTLMLLTGPLQAAPLRIDLTVTGNKSNAKNLPVCIPLSVPKEQASVTLCYVNGGGQTHLAQLTAPGLLTEKIQPEKVGLVRRDLHLILPELKAGQKLALGATLDPGLDFKLAGAFRWHKKDGEYTELVWQEGPKARPVLRYLPLRYDDSTPEQRNRTYKVFHHVYDPKGERFVTNGGHNDPYTDAKKLLYPHHRGLMFGFNKVTYGKNQKADTWHCTSNVHVAHAKILSEETGPILGRHRIQANWVGSKNDTFAHDVREVTVYHVPDGTLIDWANRLTTVNGPIKLDGDPQHAGFQFRASNEVAEKTAKQTYYVRPDGKGKPGETRNWEPKTKKGPVELPWDACSFVVGGQRYTVAYLDSPKNPGESRHSERDYGRFGYYFEYEVTKDHPLNLSYRLWLQQGEMEVPQVEALHDSFAMPPQVTVKQ